MAKDFHAEPFDKETKLKLEIFRGYIREWLPVFLATNIGYSNIALYDFFAGPGKDVKGEKGSPLIIIEEIKNYLSNSSRPHAQGININLYFNDDDKDKSVALEQAVKNEGVPAFFNVEVDSKNFTDAFKEKFPAIAAPRTANLVILDQCGVKYITSNVFKRLMDCRATDILFFISSSTVKRFAGEGCINQYFRNTLAECFENL